MHTPIYLAPMMDCTDRYFRYLLRMLSTHVVLYTEMLPVNALIFGPRQQMLRFDPIEHPIVVQLGGSEIEKLAQCAVMVTDEGYDEINVNIGCPSPRVQAGAFGACLMRKPELVADCVATIQKHSSLPISIKTRLGVDHDDSEEFLHRFISLVSAAGCKKFIIHARKAWLHGLDPKQNRTIPPLCYERVYQLKRQFPHLEIIINGGITEVAQITQQLQQVDGVMLGREFYQNPYKFCEIDNLFFDDQKSIPTRLQVIEKYLGYCTTQLQEGARLRQLLRPLIGMGLGMNHARHWRRVLCEGSTSINEILDFARREFVPLG
jgi:tRNA-dihydrouridine synthase A